MHIYYSKNSAGLRTIRHKAAVLWNELPVSLQEINSLSVFKNKTETISAVITLTRSIMFVFFTTTAVLLRLLL